MAPYSPRTPNEESAAYPQSQRSWIFILVRILTSLFCPHSSHPHLCAGRYLIGIKMRKSQVYKYELFQLGIIYPLPNILSLLPAALFIRMAPPREHVGQSASALSPKKLVQIRQRVAVLFYLVEGCPILYLHRFITWVLLEASSMFVHGRWALPRWDNFICSNI